MNGLLEKPATANAATIIVPAGEGRTISAFQDTLQVKLDGEGSNGNLTVWMATVPPGGGPPPHIHTMEDELFMIVDGEFRFLANGAWSEPYGTGTFIYTPRGVTHSFQNSGKTTGHFWGIATPSGFETFFARCADVFAQPGPPDMTRILAISVDHGIEYAAAPREA